MLFGVYAGAIFRKNGTVQVVFFRASALEVALWMQAGNVNLLGCLISRVKGQIESM